MTRHRRKQSKINNKIQEKGLVEIIEQEVKYFCPKRGWVIEKVKIKKFKPFDASRPNAIKSNDVASELDSIDDNNIFSTDESTGEDI